MPISRRDLIRRLKRLGFDGPEYGGPHPVMRKGGVRLAIPNPHGKDIDEALLARILRQAGLTRDEFERA